MELRKRSINRNFSIPKSKAKKRRKSKFICPDFFSFSIFNHQNLDYSKSLSEIEDLSCEIWFELFSYFDSQALIQRFSQLNSSIESYLRDHRLPIHLNLHSETILLPSPLNCNQILSLTIDYSSINREKIVDISSFHRLRSLSLKNLNEHQLAKTSEYQLKDLWQVSIQSKCAKFLTKILLIYYPNVKRMTINSMRRGYLIKSSLFQQKTSEIESLILHGTIKLVQLFRFWSFVPHLRCFSVLDGGIHQCDYWLDEHLLSNERLPLNLSFIHLTINDEDLSFLNLEKLIPKKIRSIKLSGAINDDDLNDYICSTNWIRLISNCSTDLQCIKLDLSSYFDPSDSIGLQKTLLKFRKDPFFRLTKIQSQNFHLTIKGSIGNNLDH